MRQRVRTFLQETFFVDDIGDDTSFLRSGALDSSGILQLVQFLEDALGFTLADDDLTPENLDSIDAVVAFAARAAERRSSLSQVAA